MSELPKLKPTITLPDEFAERYGTPSASPDGYASHKARCEGRAYQLEIRALKAVMLKTAAFLARELLSEGEIPDGAANRLRENVVQPLRAAALKDE